MGKRCRKSTDDSVARLLISWYKIREQGIAKSGINGNTRRRFSGKRPPPKECISKIGGIAVAACSGASASTAAPERPRPPRVLAPCRSSRQRPSWKLGKLFAAMRVRCAADTAAAVKAAEELVVELNGCANWATLCKLLPRIQGLPVTPSVLQQSPSIILALDTAAKRCRKGKNEAVVGLLSKWREMQRQQPQEPIQMIQDAEPDIKGHVGPSVVKEGALSDVSPQVAKRTLPEVQILSRQPLMKQRKITAFLGDAALASAGG